MNNKRLGNSFETELAELLFNNGFWVHNMAQNAAGQPADVIAVKNGNAYLIDCKVCSNASFDRSRIEDNQRLSMTLWDDCGNGAGWFAVKFGENIYMAADWMLALTDKANLSEKWFCEYAENLDEWLERARCFV